MSSWIDKILIKVLPSHTRHILASDPDGILSYHEIITAIEGRGCKIIRASTALEARVRFELDIRDSDEISILIINAPYHPLPDISFDSYFVNIGYKDIFPYFDPKALFGLSYNGLCALDVLRPYDTLGYEATLRFLLENIYHIDFEAFTKYKTKERMLAILVEVVFHKDKISTPITALLRSIVKPFFTAEEVDQLLSENELKEYLQCLWNKHAAAANLLINFSDPLLAKSLGNLFVEGILKPVKTDRETIETIPLSLRIGFYVDEKADHLTRVNALTDFINGRSVSIQDVHTEWLELGKAVGELQYLALSLNDSDVTKRTRGALNELNNRFQKFVQNIYWSLFSLNGSRYPAVISKVLEYIKAQQSPKKVLIVIDGMGLWQWHTIVQELNGQGISVNQMATFAYLPSTTGLSRQALLKGGKPDLNENNSKEEKLFRQYWIENGYQNYQICYQKFSVESPVDLDSMSSASIVALVCNDLDNLMHGAVMGNEQLLQDTQQWIRRMEIVKLVQKLKQLGYVCFITTDHGNIEARAVGNLRMTSRNLSTSRSTRHIKFVSYDDARQFKIDNPGLAVDHREESLYFTDDSAFAKEGKVITHGGSHLLEMIIPLGVIE